MKLPSLPSLPFFRKKDPKAEFEKNMAKCRRESEETPGDLRLMTKIAELYLENGDTANAIKEYLNVAKAYQSIRKNSIVVGIFRHILVLDPSQIEVYHLLVEELMKDILMGDAVEVMVKLATYYYDQDMHYESAQAIRKIKTIDPDNTFYNSKVEKFFTARNLDPEALDKIGPKTKWALIAKARTRPDEVPEGPPEGGFFNLEKVLDESTISGFISSMPESAAGDSSTERVAPNRVFDELKKFVDSDGKQNSPEFHYNLALAYLRHNDHEKAHDEFLIALYGIPDKLDCYSQLIHCCMELRWLDVAKDYINKAQKLPKLTDHDNMNLNYMMGLLCKDTGDRKKALKLFKKIYDKDTNFKTVAREIRELEQAD
jgi:tetratricopeptide (TPR) repeat protein